MSAILYGFGHRFIAAPLDVARCGTYAQYRAHLRRGQRPCQACRQAYRMYSNDYYARKRKR